MGGSFVNIGYWDFFIKSIKNKCLYAKTVMDNVTIVFPKVNKWMILKNSIVSQIYRKTYN